ncbi:MAG: efflux RND transporter permease subunit [Bacteroidetes bacterium]|uniref:efflux RND transporter permease subunit n=1 Tax=Phnomibacter sp. TaxID=2836217 RepID=UPI002FDDC6D0|nr:efflux RND transporter permease subunit [Bacteroidota bacterium]
MNISELSLRRPVLAIVINLLILLFGILGFTFLGVRDYPMIEPATVNVRTSYAGANADIIESQITEPLEKAINSVPGIKNITSTSSQGSSSISIEFDLSVPLEEAANDVRDKVSQAQRSLPSDLEQPPSVAKSDGFGESIMSMGISSNTRNQLEITEFANNVLVDRLQTIPGVSGIQIWGEKKYAMRIWMKPERMTARGVTANQISQALVRENVELPSGKIVGDNTELTVRTLGRLNTEEEFENVIIRSDANGIIRLKDVAEVVLGPENEESAFKETGVPSIGMAIVPQPGSNYISIADEFNRRFDQIKKELPADITTKILLDTTKPIRKSLEEVKETLVISIGLVVLIIFLFFRSFNMAFRPLIDIPVSLIGAFFIMYFSGFSINVLTLLAIVLATGLVVDDGIVVTENIYKKMESGMNKWAAAREGSKEIYFAVISTSITLAVVFLPIIFLQGFVGKLFREFGIVVAGAVLISALVSLTLTPVLNVKLTPKTGPKHGKFYHATEPFFRGMENGYRHLLSKFMKVRWIAFVIILLSGVGMYWFSNTLQSELAPLEDRSMFRLSVTAPEGTSYDAMVQAMDRLQNFIVDSVPEQRGVLAFTAPGFTGGGSVNSGFVRIVLCDPKDRTRSQADIVNYVQKNLYRFPEVRAFASQEQTIQQNRRGGQPVQFVIQNNNFEKLRSTLPKFLEEAKESNVLVGVDADLKFNKPEVRVEVDRLKASELGVSVADVSETLQLALTNRRLGYFIMNGKQYQVIGQVDRGDRDDPSDLKQYFVRNNRGQMITLDNLVTIQEETTPPSIYHYNRYKSATISAGLAEGKTIGDGIKVMNDLKAKLLDDSFETSLTGTSRDFAESQGNTNFALMLALVLIFLVLAAQFESFIDPFIIMVTVPLALAGGLLSLYLFDQTINIFSQIGMIMLIGLVTKNGILIVEFANQQQEKGLKKYDAAIEAATQRLRPILMTSLAMALGALPIALSLGAAATSRIPLGIVIVGGISFSLLLTLFVVPAVYSYLSTRKKGIPEAMMQDTSLHSKDELANAEM